MIKLVIEDDEGNQQLVNLDKDELEISIGRKEGSNIRLGERNVSRQHAILSKAEGKVFIEDFSRYGTRVNGKRLAEGERAEISPSDEVVVGDYRLSIQDDAISADANGGNGPSQAIPEREQPKLVVISSNFAGDEFKITKNEVVIGRTPENDIAIDDRSISRNHAKVVRISRGVFQIQDMESANGIKVKNRPVSVYQLSSGDIIELGQVRFRFCEAGENWFFDPERFPVQDVPKQPPPPPPRNNALIGIIAAVAVIGIIVVVFVATRPKDDPNTAGSTGSTNPTDPGTTELDVNKTIAARLKIIDDTIASGELETAYDDLTTLMREFPVDKHSAVKNDAPKMLDKIAAGLFASASSAANVDAMLASLAKAEEINTEATKLDDTLESAKDRARDIKAEKEFLPKFSQAQTNLQASANQLPPEQRTTCKNVSDAAVMIEGSPTKIAKSLATRADLKTAATNCVRDSYIKEIEPLIASRDKSKMSAAKALVDSLDTAFGKEAGMADKISDYKRKIDNIENPPTVVDNNPPPTKDPVENGGGGDDAKRATELEAEGDSLKASNPNKAIKAYRESLKLKNNKAVWIKLGTVQQISGLLCEAAKSFDKGGDSAKAAAAKSKGSCP